MCGHLDRRDRVVVIALNRRRGPDRDAEVASRSRCRGRLQIVSPWSPPNRDVVVAVLITLYISSLFSSNFSPSS